MPWSQKEIVEVNGQKWDPREASIVVIEGPEIPIHRLSMGRGWPLAERQGEDVTARVLDEARRAVADGSAYRQGPSPDPGTPSAPASAPAEDYPSAAPAADPLSAGVELGEMLGHDAPRLLAAWRAVSGRTAGLSPSESLALAERELGSE